MEKKMEITYVNKKNMIKFLVGSAFGVLMFLIPVPYGSSFTTLLDFVKMGIASLLGDSLIYLVTILLVIAAAVSLYDFIFKPDFIRNNNYLKKAFSTTPLYLISKIIGAAVGVMVLTGTGPEVVISGDTGGTIIDLCGTLLCILVAFSFILPFLTDCGIMEFLGVITWPVVRPLFHVPGRAAVDLIASWFGASNAAVILTRIPPISTIPNTYREATGKKVAEDLPDKQGVLAFALESSCKRASEFHVDTVLSSGLEVMMGMMFDLIPIVASWGVVALAIATYTPFFDWISYPMGLYLQLFGVQDAFTVAPATLVGFTDMFIPALLMTGMELSRKTAFIIGALSLVQIIYLTEVGTVIIKSEVPLGFWKLLLIFLERTLIAIPLLVLLANLIY